VIFAKNYLSGRFGTERAVLECFEVIAGVTRLKKAIGRTD